MKWDFQVCANIFHFKCNIPALMMDYYYYLILHYFPLGWDCLAAFNWLITPCWCTVLLVKFRPWEPCPALQQSSQHPQAAWGCSALPAWVLISGLPSGGAIFFQWWQDSKQVRYFKHLICSLVKIRWKKSCPSRYSVTSEWGFINHSCWE